METRRPHATFDPEIAPRRGSHGTLESLQVLRALAALAVMGFHATELLADRAGFVLLHDFFAPGSAGVDLFFVLSGFIITLTAPRTGGARGFLVRRAIRLLPVYWLITAALIAAHAAAPTPAMAHKGDWRVIAASFALWPAQRHVVGVAWTLVYEAWFYGLFGLLYFRSRAAFFAVLGGWSALGWANALLWHAHPESVALRYALEPILSEFLLGCAAALVYQRSRALPARALLGTGTLAFAAAWIAHWQGALAVPWPLAFGGSAAAIVLGAAAIRAPMPRWLVTLGDASYSIYLLHATALALLLRLACALDPGLAATGGVGAASVLTVSLLACVAFYQAVERPLLAACRRTWLAPRAPTARRDVAGAAAPSRG